MSYSVVVGFHSYFCLNDLENSITKHTDLRQAEIYWIFRCWWLPFWILSILIYFRNGIQNLYCVHDAHRLFYEECCITGNCPHGGTINRTNVSLLTFTGNGPTLQKFLVELKIVVLLAMSCSPNIKQNDDRYGQKLHSSWKAQALIIKMFFFINSCISFNEHLK